MYADRMPVIDTLAPPVNPAVRKPYASLRLEPLGRIASLTRFDVSVIIN